MSEEMKKKLKELSMEIKIDLAWHVLSSMMSEDEIKELQELVELLRKKINKKKKSPYPPPRTKYYKSG